MKVGGASFRMSVWILPVTLPDSGEGRNESGAQNPLVRQGEKKAGVTERVNMRMKKIGNP